MTRYRFTFAILAFIISIVALGQSKRQSVPLPAPDFAYPQKVAQQADSDLKTALKNADSQAIVNALVRYGLAKTAIDRANATEVVNRVLDIALHENNKVTKSLLYTLVAQIYWNTYTNDRSAYDQRLLPPTPLPDKLEDWSGTQMTTAIIDALDRSVADADVLYATPLSQFPQIIVADQLTLEYYPTLYDFLASRYITIIKSINNNQYQIGDHWLAPAQSFVRFDASSLPGHLSKIFAMYQRVIQLHGFTSASGVMWDTNRLAYTSTLTPYETGNDGNSSKALLQLYNSVADSDFSGIPLNAYGETVFTDDAEKTFVELANRYLDRFPDFFAAAAINNRLNDYTHPTVSVNAPALVAPDREFAMTIAARNLTEATIHFYRAKVTANDPYNPRHSAADRLVKSVTVRFDSTIYAADSTISVSLPDEGIYAIVPQIGVNIDHNNYSTITASNASLSRLSAQESSWAVVTDLVTGQPIEGRKVYGEVWVDRTAKRKAIGTTNRNGMVKITDSPNTTNITLLLPDGTPIAPLSSYYTRRNPEPSIHAEVITSLPLYHPGDSLQCAVIAYTWQPNGNTPLSNRQLTLTLRSANLEQVAQVTVTTDTWGRAKTTFNIPKNGLTGSYPVEVTYDKKVIGSTGVMVSDYKLPEMEITADTPQVSPGSSATITGRVATYTGFPMADAKVTLSMTSQSPWRWWRYSSGKEWPFYTAEATTNADGVYRFVIPQSVLANAPLPDGVFSVDLQATSSSGETQSTNTTFFNIKSYAIKASVNQTIDADEPVKVNCSVIGMDGKSDNLPVSVTVIRDKSEVATMPLPADGVLNLSSLPSGRYTLRFSLTDTKLKYRSDDCDVILYRRNDTHSPVNNVLWVPQSHVKTDQSRRATIMFEAKADTTNVLVTTATLNGQPRLSWYTAHSGMNTIDVDVPANSNSLVVGLFAVNSLEYSSEDIVVITPELDRSVKLEIETLRDRVMPGNQETITLRLVNNDDQPVTGAVLIDIWNSALGALYNHSVDFKPLQPFTPYYSLSSDVGDQSRTSYSLFGKRLSTTTLQPPTLQLYKRQFGSMRADRFNYIGHTRMYKAASRPNSMKEAADYDDAAVVEYAEAEATVAGAMMDNSVAGSQVTQWRDSEVPLALFDPTLTTDNEGRLAVTYTVPNANARWTLSAIAYDSGLLTSSLSSEIYASKPIMVQPNMPRFLRLGDTAQLRAIVMNDTEADQRVVTTFEFFDPATGETIASRQSIDRIGPRSTANVAVEVEVPDAGTALGYRISSATGNYSDGERGMIPLYPSVAPVIESDNFYMQADQIVYEADLPAGADDTVVTLEFCENPSWYVVAALPGLRANVNSTANSAAAAIFSAAVADGLLRTNPTIKSMINRWLTSDRSDSTLVSALEKNPDLKIALLNATPWMLDARNDTERMARLALLFDKKEIKSTNDECVKQLSKLQKPGGGWSWYGKYDKADFWTTLNVLEMMGDLRRLNFDPNNRKLTEMVNNAVSYIDREAADRFKRFPQSDFTLYTYVRGLFPDISVPTAASKVISTTVERLLAEWKDMGIAEKATAAIILNNNDYAATARQILQSLREYSTTTTGGGMWWRQLDQRYTSQYYKLAAAGTLLEAFASIPPQNEDVDRIRQWVVVQKQTQDWGDAVVTTQLITSFLMSGTQWTVPPVGVSVEAASHEVVIPRPAAATGYLRTDLSQYLTTKASKLMIVKRGDYPAWGAVFTRQPMNLTDVKAKPCDGLSIEKSIYRVNYNPDGITVDQPKTLNVGDRVRIDLLIKAERDIDYVAIIDQRAACFEPADQLPAPVYEQGVYFYRENRDAATNIYVDRLPAGTYRISYEMLVNNAGTFASGIATAQSQYAPAITAHSSGAVVKVTP